MNIECLFYSWLFMEAFHRAYKKWRHTIQITNTQTKYQWQASKHFNWPKGGQYNFIFFIGTINIFLSLSVFSSMIFFVSLLIRVGPDIRWFVGYRTFARYPVLEISQISGIRIKKYPAQPLYFFVCLSLWWALIMPGYSTPNKT